MWLPPASMKSKPLRTQYVLALFWGVGLLTGTFEGALPRCNAEFAFTLTVTLLGFVLFVYACATLFMLSKSERNQTKLARARINQLRHLLTFHHVPESLQLQAVEYLKRHYTEADSNDRDVVKMLCPSITKDIQVELLKDVIGRIPLFRGCSQPFIVALTSLLEIKSFPAHVTLFEAGAKGDYMYVVNSGVLHILVNGVKVRELRQGSFFGEVSVFSKRPRSAAVITTSYCTLYRLSRFHIERVLEGYPEYASQISATIDDMVDEHGARASETPHGGSEEFMLTTLFQLTTKLPAKRKKSSLRDKAKIVTTASMRRSKSTKVLSASRHSEYDGGNISMSENRAINFSPIPIQLPSTVIIKKPSGKLVRSQSAYARRVSSGVAWWLQRAGSTKSLNSSRVDTMQGFYDNLSRRQGSQPSAGGAMSNIIGKLLMRRVIDHTSHWRRTWLILLQIHLAVNWYIVPMLLAFPILDCPDAYRSLHVVYTVLDVLLVIDMYLNFHLTFTASRKKVTQPSQLAKHYLRRSFIADLLCVLPYQLLAPASNASVLIAHPALFRVPRLFRAWRIKGHKKEWESSFHLGSTSWIIVLRICYTLLLHILACVYFSLTYLEGFGSGANSWLPPSDLDLRRTFDGRMEYIGGQSNISYSQVEAHTVAGMQYALSLYFGVTMLTTLGKTVEPSSTLQYSVALVFMVSGFILLSIMIDSVQESVTTSAFEQKEFLVTRTRVQNFIRSRTVPSGVQQRVKSFLEFWWSSHRGAIVSDLLNELPDSIKRPVLRSMCQPALRTLTLLADVRSSLDALELVFVDNARFILYGQGEIIYRQGDYANGLFFLLEGELIIIANGGMPRTIVKGGFIGTAALNLNETSVSYEERVTAASGCILIYVSRDHLNGMHRVFPTFSMALRALEKRLEGAKLARAQQDYSGRERSSSGSLRSIPDMKKLTFEMKVLKYVGFDDVVFDPDDSTSELWKLCTFGFTIALYFKVIDDLASGVKSSISDVVQLIDASSREFNGKISSLRLLLAHFRLPSGIEGQLKTYFFFQRYHTITQEYLLERCLPPSLLTEIRLVHLQPMIAKVGFLAGMEGSVTRMLVSQLVQALTVKNQFVFHLGEEGSNMFFVFTGIIEVLVPLETLYRRQSHDTKLNSLGSPSRSSFHTFFPTLDPSKLQAKNQLKKVNELTSGSYFGEVALFTNKPRSAHARCKTSCVLYKLSRRSLELVFERYPDWKRKVLKIVNIQQEQQHLRNLYMEEQMDMAAKTSKSVLNHADILGDATHLGTTNRSTNSSAGSYSDRVSFRMKNGMRKPSTRPIRNSDNLQTAGQMKNAPWVDMLLPCTEAQSSFHVQWLRVIAFGTVYMALVVPYRNAYDSLERLSPLPIATRAVELTCEVLFGWDIWVNWNLKDGLESLEVYENKHRDTYAEYTFTLFADFVGLIAMAFMIGEMANLYVSYICNEVEFRKNHTAVDMYLDRWHITGKLRARSHAFFSSLWSSHRGVNYQTIFDEIPQVIRIEAIMHIAYLPLRVFINNVFRPFATTHPHDRDVEAITRAIAQRLRYEGYPRDECVLIEGSVSKEMYFVVKGHLMSTNSSEPLLEVSSQRSSLHYKKGDYFGDLGLLGYSVGVSTVKTISACDLLSLSSEDLLEVILSRSLFQTALSIAVGGYRELCKRKRWDVMSRKDNAKAAEEDWGVELFGILNTRKKQWLDEALQFNAGVDSDPMNEPWTVSCLKPGQEVGMATISSPHACVKMFEKLLRLIATRGLLDVNNLHQSAAQFQDTLPVMTADLSTHRSTISVTERSDSSKLSSNKLSYLH
ncbi:unnamed protein product [Phytophthora lilii]|uniref:Unnamed protein product n=1 Tax=Phytophthora lilii TaxID=2077276 RepID=A0A9W6WW73_9STRA|nr:unnamed protein product [Phytophthora lilii]